MHANEIDEFKTLSTRHPSIEIEIVETTASTNADLMDRARRGAITTPVLRLAFNQTSGRGRLGRQWWSQAHHSLTFSIGWRFEIPVERLNNISLAIGACLAETLNRYLQNGIAVQLKWPNDLLIDQKKLGGVLIETHSVRSVPMQTIAVIGIGINLTPFDTTDVLLDQKIAVLSDYLSDYSPNKLNSIKLISILLKPLIDTLESFAIQGFMPWVDRFNDLLAFKNQTVNILEQGKIVYSGEVKGINQAGQLLLATADAVQTLSTGELSLRVQ